MKVFFEFSRKGLLKYLKSFEIIRKTIVENKHKLTRDILLNTKKNSNSKTLSPKIFKTLNKSISNADCIIIEGSTISLALSYVLTQSITLDKPVLFLYHSKSPDIKRSRFVKIIESKLLVVAEYNEYLEIPEIINNFFNETKYIKTRFNLVLPSDINSFVTLQSKNKQISKTKYIIDLIEKEINQ